MAPEGETSTMVVVKWSDKVEGSVDDIDSPLCGGLYKNETDIVPWSVTDPDAKMNCFTWSTTNPILSLVLNRKSESIGFE